MRVAGCVITVLIQPRCVQDVGECVQCIASTICLALILGPVLISALRCLSPALLSILLSQLASMRSPASGFMRTYIVRSLYVAFRSN